MDHPVVPVTYALRGLRSVLLTMLLYPVVALLIRFALTRPRDKRQRSAARAC